MPAPKRTYRQQSIAGLRDQIKAEDLIKRLQNNALGKIKPPMTQTQVHSAMGLLKKVMPDLSNVESKVDMDTEITIKWKNE